VCEYCERQRGTGLAALAHSETPFETCDGKTHCVPRALEIEIQLNFENQLQSRWNRIKLKEEIESARHYELLELEARYDAEIEEVRRCKKTFMNGPSQLVMKHVPNAEVLALKTELKQLEERIVEGNWVVGWLCVRI